MKKVFLQLMFSIFFMTGSLGAMSKADLLVLAQQEGSAIKTLKQASQVFGLDINKITQEDLDKTFKQLQRQYHPDRYSLGEERDNADRIFKLIGEAKDYLNKYLSKSDSDKKKQRDNEAKKEKTNTTTDTQTREREEQENKRKEEERRQREQQESQKGTGKDWIVLMRNSSSWPLLVKVYIHRKSQPVQFRVSAGDRLYIPANDQTSKITIETYGSVWGYSGGTTEIYGTTEQRNSMEEMAQGSSYVPVMAIEVSGSVSFGSQVKGRMGEFDSFDLPKSLEKAFKSNLSENEAIASAMKEAKTNDDKQTCRYISMIPADLDKNSVKASFDMMNKAFSLFSGSGEDRKKLDFYSALLQKCYGLL